MPLSDERWRFVVEDVLGVRPAQCEALVDAVARRHSAAERARAIAREVVPRALVAGAPSGLANTLVRSVGLALLEQRAMMRHRATLLASLGYLDDPRFFERSDWPRRALGLSVDNSAAAVLASEGVRFGLRLAALRGAQTATRVLGRRAASLAGAVVGTLFDGVEIIGFAESALQEREVARRRAWESAAPTARVVPLLVGRGRRGGDARRTGVRGRHTEEDEGTTEGT